MDSPRGPSRLGAKEGRLLPGPSGPPSSGAPPSFRPPPNNNSSSSSSSRIRVAPALAPESEALFAAAPSEEEARASAARRVWRFYLWGQLANVMKAAVWWSSFGVLSVSLLGFPLAVGLLRAAFNAALVLLSPLASAAAETTSMRALLLSTTAARWLVWGVGIPAAWLGVYVHLNRPDWFLLIALSLVFLDGIQVAFSNVVDVDCGGLDALSAQLELPLLSSLRDRFGRLHNLTFNLSFILFTPPVALLLLYLCPWLPLPLYPTGTVEGGSPTGGPPLWQQLLDKVGALPSRYSECLCLLLGQGFVFGCLSLLSLCFYAFGLPSQQRTQSGSGGPSGGPLHPHGGMTAADTKSEGGASGGRQGGGALAGGGADALRGAGAPPPLLEWGGGPLGHGGGESVCSEDSLTDFSGGSESPSLWAETVVRLRDVKEGFHLVLGKKALAWRVLFLALETALEDSVVSVLLPLLALYTPSLFGGVKALGWEGGPPVEGPLLMDPTAPAPAAAAAAAAPVSILAANVWATCLISAGKVGGCLGSSVMQRLWGPPSLSAAFVSSPRSQSSSGGRSSSSSSGSSSYRCLFGCVFCSSLALLLLPLALLMREEWGAPWSVSVGLVFVSSLLFFAFSSAPKMGFAALLQSLVVSQQAACKVFGFVGAFVTVVDALCILLVNGLFVSLLPRGPLAAVSAVCVLFLAHGLLEAILGPLLVLDSEEAGDEASPGSPLDNNSRDGAYSDEEARGPLRFEQRQAFLQGNASQLTTTATSS
ncbi:hypothetical protein Emed_005171 [Eimeria media]